MAKKIIDIIDDLDGTLMHSVTHGFAGGLKEPTAMTTAERKSFITKRSIPGKS